MLIHYLVLVLVSEDAGVSVAGSVSIVAAVVPALVVTVAGVGVAGVVAVAGVVVAGPQQRVAVVAVSTEEVLALQEDAWLQDDIQVKVY